MSIASLRGDSLAEELGDASVASLRGETADELVEASLDVRNGDSIRLMVAGDVLSCRAISRTDSPAAYSVMASDWSRSRDVLVFCFFFIVETLMKHIIYCVCCCYTL